MATFAKAPIYCAVPGCRNHRSIVRLPNGERHYITMHSLPKDLEARQKWIEFTTRDPLPKKSRLCSEHFAEKDYLYNDEFLQGIRKCRFLEKTAVPVRFHPIVRCEGSIKIIYLPRVGKWVEYDGVRKPPPTEEELKKIKKQKLIKRKMRRQQKKAANLSQEESETESQIEQDAELSQMSDSSDTIIEVNDDDEEEDDILNFLVFKEENRKKRYNERIEETAVVKKKKMGGETTYPTDEVFIVEGTASNSFAIVENNKSSADESYLVDELENIVLDKIKKTLSEIRGDSQKLEKSCTILAEQREKLEMESEGILKDINEMEERLRVIQETKQRLLIPSNNVGENSQPVTPTKQDFTSEFEQFIGLNK